MTYGSQWRLRSAWASAQSYQSIHCQHEDTLGPLLIIECTVKTDQTGRMPRLIWVFSGHPCHFVGFVVLQLILSYFVLFLIFSCCQIWSTQRTWLCCACITGQTVSITQSGSSGSLSREGRSWKIENKAFKWLRGVKRATDWELRKM